MVLAYYSLSSRLRWLLLLLSLAVALYTGYWLLNFTSRSDEPALTNNIQSAAAIERVELPKCPDLEQNAQLRGALNMTAEMAERPTNESQVEAANGDVGPGGSWRPRNCTAPHRTVFIIPYRNRERHLVQLLGHLLPILKRQLLDFRFIVTEQTGTAPFNKGRIMNAAYAFVKNESGNSGAHFSGVDCLIFHDVDMLPENDRTPYGCPPAAGTARHIGVFVNKLDYQWVNMNSDTTFGGSRLLYNELVGGVLALRTGDFERLNGFSNAFWGYGAEDDDMGKRILAHNFTIERPPQSIRFTMADHKKAQPLSAEKLQVMLNETVRRMDTEGLNENGKWRLAEVQQRPLYHRLVVDVGEPPEEVKALAREQQQRAQQG